ncbi:unnamed protein product [Rotaria sp. Silwood2]|nr:unnamed protein product [Rotaria sp. Silwood2]CAF2914660.1 unnamed protein product [Rotaria sp. Silwood2]CAF3174502.1 unnamed protein product [Rotaria sp. Silwood2]CAF3323353.1 unnamed protein product [Rotaria sp. Silwood2]CAF4015212.1 unnamed protein product [Rotaria sp. Silwood2]
MTKSIYDRQLDINLFKRLHPTNFALVPKRSLSILGPGSYNPITIDEIYRQKSCSKYGPYYQQSNRFPSINRKSKHLCYIQPLIYGLSNIPDELRRKNEFKRRYNAIRLDRQSNDICRKRRELAPRAPPVTLYEKSSFVDELKRIYGPYVKLAQDYYRKIPDWYKGPARLQIKSPPSILESLFSKSNCHKGKFLPIPSNLNANENQIKTSPGPTTYFKDTFSQRQPSKINQEKTSLLGFLSSTERFHKTKLSISHLGPASYKPEACIRLCSNKTKKQRNK